MKNISFTACFILFILLSFSCKERSKGKNSLPVINIEAGLNNMQPINLSQFTDNIRYVPIETYANHYFVWTWQCVFSDSLILARGSRFILLYNFKGKCISKIGNYGKGPEEWQYAMNFGFGFNKNVYILSSYGSFDSYNLLEYNLDGTFRNKYKFKRNSTGLIQSWIPINDSLFFGTVSNLAGHEENMGVIFNKNGEIKFKYKNYNILNHEKRIYSSTFGYPKIYRFENDIVLKQFYNDTLFYLTEQYQLIPKYVFNSGRFSIPYFDEKENPRDYGLKTKNSIWVEEVFQTSDFLLFRCNLNDNFPSKRLTPQTVSGPFGIVVESFNTQYTLGIYNKQTGNLILCKPNDTDNILFASGLCNDVDAGPMFRPNYQVNDSTMVMWFLADEFKAHVASDDFKNNTPKYPEKKKELEELAKTISEFNNPVLMFVTFKISKK